VTTTTADSPALDPGSAGPEGVFIRTADGERLYLEHFLPSAKPHGVVVFVHGYSTYSGLYRPLARTLADKGFVVTLFDVRGHGRSSGRRGFVREFADYARDLSLVIAEARAGHGRLPLFVVAHSHGCLITLDYVRSTPDHGIAGVVAAAPFLGLKLKVPAYKLALANPLSRLWPTCALGNELEAEDLVRNEELRAYLANRVDPFIFHVATARWFTECRAAQARVLESAPAFAVPMCVQIPDDDRLVDADVTRGFVARANPSVVEAITYPELFHELMLDTGCEEVISDLTTWLTQRSERLVRADGSAR